MASLMVRSRPEMFGPVIRKLKSLGSAASNAGVEALLDRIKMRAGASRGGDIIDPGNAPTRATVLLEGTACSYQSLKDGNRQIHAFQYPGDFCDLHRHVLPDSNNEVAVAALTDCSIGII